MMENWNKGTVKYWRTDGFPFMPRHSKHKATFFSHGPEWEPGIDAISIILFILFQFHRSAIAPAQRQRGLTPDNDKG